MRIGEASKRSGVPVSTIRYYIRRGLIVPDGEGPQYLFDEQDCHTLERIVQFKKWGLSLETAHRLLPLERVSSGVEQDTVEDCVALLRTHQKQLEDQRVRYQHYKEEINEFIDELNRQAGGAAWQRSCADRRAAARALTAVLPALRRRVPDQQGRYGYVRYFFRRPPL